MGILSRKLFPACESMCICCPALRSSSKQPVKRYKKLLADIFPKSMDVTPNERKIVKLCEYAAKNPIRIPKITKILDEKCMKELRNGQFKGINIIVNVYSKMLSLCKEQMAYFAINLLKVVSDLLEKPKQDSLMILGCETLTKFIYSQNDGTYAHNIEKHVMKVIKLSSEEDDGANMRGRASSLSCMSAMIWFMSQYSYTFHAFDEIVGAILDNYRSVDNTTSNESKELQRNWVDEIARSEGRVGAGNEFTSGSVVVRQRPEKKDHLTLTKQESETPKVWAQICLQRMVELGKESTTMRRLLDPMLSYFDIGRHWSSPDGLALAVLSDMAFFVEKSGQRQIILASVVRHLDNKNVVHDPVLKSQVIQVGTSLARQIRLGATLSDGGLVSDLCRHLRKSLQATYASVNQYEPDMNFSFQSSIEDCLFEIAKGIGDSQPLLDMIALALEKLPSSGVSARATVGSLMILAHIISLLPCPHRSKQAFPEELLVQLIKAMVHADVEVRVGAHQLLSILLVPGSAQPKNQVSFPRSRRWGSDNASIFASVSSLLEKLREDMDFNKKVGNDNKTKEWCEEYLKQDCSQVSISNLYKFGSILDLKTGNSKSLPSEVRTPCFMTLNEDQIPLLLTAFWIQASLPDNVPSNYEAIAHSYALTLTFSKWKGPGDHVLVQFFQLPLSLRNAALDPANGTWPPSCRRSVFSLAMCMLLTAANLYKISELISFIRSFMANDVDPFLSMNEDFHFSVRPNVDSKNYGSSSDYQQASSLMCELRSLFFEHDLTEMSILVKKLSALTEMEADAIAGQLSEAFTPDDALLFGTKTLLDLEPSKTSSHLKESLSFDEVAATGSLFDDEVTSEPFAVNISRLATKIPAPPPSQVISIGELLESAREMAGQVAGTAVSTSPLPYEALSRQCQALGTGTQKILSSCLSRDNTCPEESAKGALEIIQIPNSTPKASSCSITDICATPPETSLALRLPPASPYDYFLKAARSYDT